MNIHVSPSSGAISFNTDTAGNATVSLATFPKLQYDGGGGISVISTSTGVGFTDKFKVEGATSRVFTVTDATTGVLLDCTTALGLPILEVYHLEPQTTITLGPYGTSAFVLNNTKLGLGTATPDEALHVMGNIKATGTSRFAGIYGGMYVDDGAATQTIPTGTTYTKLTCYTTNGSSSNMTADSPNDKLTVTVPAKYLVTVSISFSGTANSDWRIAVFHGGVEMPNIHASRKLGSGGDVGSACLSGILNATVSGDLDVRVRHSAVGNQDITVQYSNVTAVYIGD